MKCTYKHISLILGRLSEKFRVYFIDLMLTYIMFKSIKEM